MTLRQICGRRIRRRRQALGWTQQELAKVTRIPYPTLSRIEHGEQSMHFERMAALAEALEVSTDYLMHRTDDPATTRTHEAPAAPQSRAGGLGGQ